MQDFPPTAASGRRSGFRGIDNVTCDYIELALPGVRQLTPYQPGKPIEELERELGITGSVKLASNENPLGPSLRAMDAARGVIEGISFYPDGNGFALKAALATHTGAGPAQITLGNGSNEILELVARAWLAPGREAIFSEHAFAVYPIVTQAVGATARVARANPADHAMPHGHDLDAIADLINAETRVIFIANPNNPTGTWLTRDALEAFLDRVPESVIVVLDEAYFEYVEEAAYPDGMAWVGRYPNLIVTRTFSKIYGLAGLRIGYAVSSPQVADVLNRVRQPFNTSLIAQAAAVAALGDREHVAESVRVNREGLAQLVAGCEARGWGYIPSVGNFLCIDVGADAGGVYQALLREGVIVRPVGNYGLPNYLRVTVGTSKQNERVLAALAKVRGA